jgi:hypothetical protein
VNVVCKYSEQEENLRVVENIMGTTQALYYRITTQGLQGNDGVVLYSPEQYAKTKQAIQLSERRKNEEIERIARVVEQSKRTTHEIASYKMNFYDPWMNVPDGAIITNCSIRAGQENWKYSDRIDFADIVSITLDTNGIRVNTIEVQFVTDVIRENHRDPEVEIFRCCTDDNLKNFRSTLIKAYRDWSGKFPDARMPFSSSSNQPDLRQMGETGDPASQSVAEQHPKQLLTDSEYDEASSQQLEEWANEGDVKAQIHLASQYFDGKKGLTENKVAGYKWAVIAAASKKLEATSLPGDFEMLMSSDQISQGKALAQAFLNSKTSKK